MRLYHTLLRVDFTLDGSTLECDSSNTEARELARDLTTCLRYEGLAGESAYRYLRDAEPIYRVDE
jgi:hypothetical protein